MTNHLSPLPVTERVLPCSAPSAAPAACPNCGAGLTGPYCASCGQRDIPPYPSTRELVIDAFRELYGWDGRFASTVRTLVQQPGMLTREFLEGRRARYLSPLRLYLLASLAYFFLAAAVPNVRVGSAARPAGYETMPRMLFALLPVFAAIVGLFYRGRNYPEHPYFAIHLHAFTFLALILTALAKFTRLSPLVAAMGAVTMLSIPVYATLAFRRVYGGSLARTVATEIAIGKLYGTVAIVGFAGMLYLVSVTT